MLSRSEQFYTDIKRRHSIRKFSDRAVDQAIIENCLKAAGTAPNGANHQPWHFVALHSSEVTKQGREQAEAHEQGFYSGRAGEEWLAALQPLGTDANKPFLEIAPYLIIVFKRPFEYDEDGTKHQNYYVNESVGLACGMLISAIHNAGLVTLTHTPSPMRFLEKILERPGNERAFLLLPVGYAANEAYVPDIKRKKLKDVMKIY